MTSNSVLLSADLAASREKALNRPPPNRMPATANEAVAERTGREFEAMFLSQMLQPIFETVKSNAMFGGGPGEEAFKTLLVDEYGKIIAKAGGIGIAGQVKRQILAFQARQEFEKTQPENTGGSVTLSVDAMRAAYRKAGAAEGKAPPPLPRQTSAALDDPSVVAAPRTNVSVQKLKS